MYNYKQNAGVNIMEVKRGESEIVDYLMDNWNSTDTEVKLNYLRLILKKYNEERK